MTTPALFEKNFLSYVLSSNLQGRRRFIAIEIARAQENGEVKHKVIAEILGMSVGSLRRGISELKEEGVLSVKRTGQRSWEYSFRVEKPIPDYSPVGTQDGKAIPDYSPMITQKRKRVKTEVKHHEQLPIVNSEEAQNPDCSRRIYNNNLIYLEDHRVLIIPTRTNIKKEETPSPVEEGMKPEETLKGIADSILAKSTLTLPKRDIPWTMDKPKTRKNMTVERMRRKAPEDYNCLDLMQIYKFAWEDKGWKGMRGSWSKTELAIMKRLIDGYGAVEMVETISWMFQNWESIRAKYRLTCSYPTVQVLSGFSASWVPEALNGPTIDTRKAAEFNKTLAEKETEAAEDLMRKQGKIHLLDGQKTDEYYLAVTEAKRQLQDSKED